MLFAGCYYYPDGGWEDFRGYFDSVEEAIEFLLKNWKNFEVGRCDWAHFVKEGKIVLYGTSDDSRFSSVLEWKFSEDK